MSFLKKLEEKGFVTKLSASRQSNACRKENIMEKQEFSLGEYLAGGIERIVKRAVRATLTDPRESAFMARFALSSREAARKRAEAESSGENIPPFLIASITSSCNLHCAGCYARHNNACTDCAPVDQLTSDDWKTFLRRRVSLG